MNFFETAQLATAMYLLSSAIVLAVIAALYLSDRKDHSKKSSN